MNINNILREEERENSRLEEYIDILIKLLPIQMSIDSLSREIIGSKILIKDKSQEKEFVQYTKEILNKLLDDYKMKTLNMYSELESYLYNELDNNNNINKKKQQSLIEVYRKQLSKENKLMFENSELHCISLVELPIRKRRNRLNHKGIEKFKDEDILKILKSNNILACINSIYRQIMLEKMVNIYCMTEYIRIINENLNCASLKV